VAYTPDWEPLAHALKRIMKTGASEDEAKIDLCRAVADRKIDVRVRIAATDYAMRGRVFSGRNVDVPAHLDPRDFDWVQSRPLAQWSIGPKLGEHYSWISDWENRPLDLIELSTDERRDEHSEQRERCTAGEARWWRIEIWPRREGARR
jgi:hypothetical protein